MYRNIICGHVLDNWREWEEEVRIQHHPNGTEDAYKHEMLEISGWATQLEVTVATLVLSVVINI